MPLSESGGLISPAGVQAVEHIADEARRNRRNRKCDCRALPTSPSSSSRRFAQLGVVGRVGEAARDEMQHRREFRPVVFVDLLARELFDALCGRTCGRPRRRAFPSRSRRSRISPAAPYQPSDCRAREGACDGSRSPAPPNITRIQGTSVERRMPRIPLREVAATGDGSVIGHRYRSTFSSRIGCGLRHRPSIVCKCRQASGRSTKSRAWHSREANRSTEIAKAELSRSSRSCEVGQFIGWLTIGGDGASAPGSASWPTSVRRSSR